jgi:hypothetical protein
MAEQENKKIAGGVEYHIADQQYFEKRHLKKYAVSGHSGLWGWAL